MCARWWTLALPVFLGATAGLARSDEAATPELRHCLKQQRSMDWRERDDGVICLGKLAKSDLHARRAVIGALRDRRADVRVSAAFALGELGPQAAKEVVTPLVDALNDEEGWVFRTITEAFGKIGPEAIPALEAALPRHNVAAACALAVIGEPALPALIRAVKDPKTRGPAAGGIACMGEKAAPALPALVDALKDPGFRLVVLDAMRAIGKGAAPAVPALIEALDDADQHVRVGAIGVLAAIGPEAAPAVPKLWAMSRDTMLDNQTRMNAERAVKKIQGR